MSVTTEPTTRPQTGKPPTDAKLDPSVTELLNLLGEGGGGKDTAPVQPVVAVQKSPPTKPGKSKSDYDEELRQAMPTIVAARGLAALTDKTKPALEAMEDAFNAAAVADGKKDFEAASASLNTALTQAKGAGDRAGEEFLARQTRAVQGLGKTPERINKLTTPPPPVTQALKTATDAQLAAKAAGETKPADWPKAYAALKDFENASAALGPECLKQAGIAATGYTQRYKDIDDNKPSGKGMVTIYSDYAAAAKTLDGLVKGGDGLAALEACRAADVAVKALETAASQSDAQKNKRVKAAFDTIKKLKDRELAKKSTQEKAELALELCANGTPAKGSEEIKQLVRLYNKSPPDKQFLKKREQQRAAIVDKVAKMPEIADLYDKKGKLDTAAWNKFIKNPDNVKNLLENISNVLCDTLGIPRIPVNKEPDPPEGVDDEGGLTFGGYDPKSNKINLNLHPDCLKPVEEALVTILHETFHAHQDVIVRKLKAGEIKPGDPDYPTALMYMVNDIPIGYLFSSVVGRKNYASQPTEIDAEEQGKLAGRAVLAQVKKASKSKGRE
jgi:hypothetical protein